MTKQKHFKLTRAQRDLLAKKFGTYKTYHWGEQLESAAYRWLEEQDNLEVEFDWGCAEFPTTVRFLSAPEFTPEQINFLNS